MINIFTINLFALGVWAILFRKRLDPRNGGSPLFLVIVSVQLLLIMAISPIVSDAINYATYASVHSYGNVERGWVILSELTWTIWPNAKSLVLVVGAIVLVSFAVFAWNLSRNLASSYFVFVAFGFWGMSFFILRQSVALAILLTAYLMVLKRKPVSFVLLVLLAAQFHQTAFLFLLLYPVSSFERNAAYHLVAIALGMFMFVFAPSILNWFFLQFRNGAIYSLTELSGANYLLLLIGIQIGIALLNPRSRNDVLLHSLEVGSVLQVLSLSFSVFTRAVQYFSISLTCAIPNAIKNIESDSLKLLFQLMFVLFGLIYYSVVLDYSFPGGVNAWRLDLTWL